MNKALFVTTNTTEPVVNVNAWIQSMGDAQHITFDINGPKNDEAIIAKAKEYAPDVIFYTGGVAGEGLPNTETFRTLRTIAKSVMLQGDFADPPFFPILDNYRDLFNENEVI